MPEASLTGRLVVATPSLRDPNFLRTVVLLIDHGPGGAVGVVLNRPSTTPVGDPLPQWVERAAAPAVVFVGGPVQSQSAICLARSAAGEQREGWHPLFHRLGTVDLGIEPGLIGVDIDALRVFAGYAGWGPGQLEGEIAAGAWWVVRSVEDDAMSGEPALLWRSVLKRQSGALAAAANFPPDLSVN